MSAVLWPEQRLAPVLTLEFWVNISQSIISRGLQNPKVKEYSSIIFVLKKNDILDQVPVCRMRIMKIILI